MSTTIDQSVCLCFSFNPNELKSNPFQKSLYTDDFEYNFGINNIFFIEKLFYSHWTVANKIKINCISPPFNLKYLFRLKDSWLWCSIEYIINLVLYYCDTIHKNRTVKIELERWNRQSSNISKSSTFDFIKEKNAKFVKHVYTQKNFFLFCQFSLNLFVYFKWNS